MAPIPVSESCDICSGYARPMTSGVRTVVHNRRINICAICRKTVEKIIDALVREGQIGIFVVHPDVLEVECVDPAERKSNRRRSHEDSD